MLWWLSMATTVGRSSYRTRQLCYQCLSANKPRTPIFCLFFFNIAQVFREYTVIQNGNKICMHSIALHTDFFILVHLIKLQAGRVSDIRVGRTTSLNSLVLSPQRRGNAGHHSHLRHWNCSTHTLNGTHIPQVKVTWHVQGGHSRYQHHASQVIQPCISHRHSIIVSIK